MTFVFVIYYQIKRMEQINTNALCEQLRKSHPCNTNIGSMLGKHNLTNENYFDKTVYHELFVWPRKKDYVTFLVGNQYLPLNKHQEKHEYHPLFDNPDISKYIAYYL